MIKNEKERRKSNKKFLVLVKGFHVLHKNMSFFLCVIFCLSHPSTRGIINSLHLLLLHRYRLPQQFQVSMRLTLLLLLLSMEQPMPLTLIDVSPFVEAASMAARVESSRLGPLMMTAVVVRFLVVAYSSKRSFRQKLRHEIHSQWFA